MVANQADLEARLSPQGNEAARAISRARHILTDRRTIECSDNANLARQFLKLLGLEERVEIELRQPPSAPPAQRTTPPAS